MAQDYYTLEEAAQVVRMSPEELKQLARKGSLRSFQDRGTWRFRVQDIQELARTRGVGSDPELVLGEAPVPKPTDSPAPRSPAVKSREAEVFDFTLDADDEHIGIGGEFLGSPGGSGRNKPSSSRKNPKSGPRSGGPPSPGPKSPVPPPGSDSDVRLVADGSDLDFQLQIDSDAKLIDDPRSGPQVKQPPKGKTGMGGPPSPSRLGPPSPSKLGPTSPAKLDPKRRSGLPPAAPPTDSGVRLVPMDSDSDVRIVGPGSDDAVLNLGHQPPRSTTDSDIRLERGLPPSPGSDQGLLTEEINLDEELQKEAARKSSPQAKVRPKPPSQPAFPSTSPFELSESDLNLPAAPADAPPGDKPSSSDFDLTPAAGDDSPLMKDSSDFDLTPAGQSSSPLEPSSDDDFRLELPDDEVALGEPSAPSDLSGPRSGISLENPVDSGISLEQGGEGSDEIEFTLSLDAESTPKPGSPAAAKQSGDSSSEFELTLDSDEAKAPADSSSSEFELTLDSDEKPAGGESSDSEFELTLDDSGGLSPLDEEPQAKVAGDKDIFDTDFDVPALEEESGSEAMALEEADTGLESSDFDLELGDDDVASEEESGSQVIALDEEEVDDAQMTQQALKTRGRRQAAAELEVDEEAAEIEEGASFEDLDISADEEGLVEEAIDEEEEPHRTVVKEKLIPAAPWGAMPVVLMLPCVLVMALVVLLGFELVQGMNGYKSPGLLTKALGDLLGQKFK